MKKAMLVVVEYAEGAEQKYVDDQAAKLLGRINNYSPPSGIKLYAVLVDPGTVTRPIAVGHSANRSGADGMTTKGDLLAAMEGLPDDTVIEIHVPGSPVPREAADFAIGDMGVVIGTDNPIWFNLAVGEFITNCGC